jgi:hypothetical protein
MKLQGCISKQLISQKRKRQINKDVQPKIRKLEITVQTPLQPEIIKAEENDYHTISNNENISMDEKSSYQLKIAKRSRNIPTFNKLIASVCNRFMTKISDINVVWNPKAIIYSLIYL